MSKRLKQDGKGGVQYQRPGGASRDTVRGWPGKSRTVASSQTQPEQHRQRQYASPSLTLSPAGPTTNLSVSNIQQSRTWSTEMGFE